MFPGLFRGNLKAKFGAFFYKNPVGQFSKLNGVYGVGLFCVGSESVIFFQQDMVDYFFTMVPGIFDKPFVGLQPTDDDSSEI